MSERKTVSQTSGEISSKIRNITEINKEQEIDHALENILMESLLKENNIDLGSSNSVKRRVRLEKTKIIDTELEQKWQDIERELLIGYDLEESKEEKILEGNDDVGNYIDDFPEDYYFSNYCHESGSDNMQPTSVTRDEISYEDCGGNSKSKFNKGRCLLSPAENPEVVFASSDEIMKYNAFNTPIGLMARCNPSTCRYGGKCISKMTLDDIMAIKTTFWGEMDVEAPSRSTRRDLILQILQHAIDRRTKQFEFTFGGKEHSNSVICEAAMLIALGLSNHSNASRAPSQWINAKKWVLESYDLDKNLKYSYAKVTASNSRQTVHIEREAKRLKFEDACAFILYFADEFGDKVSSADTGDPDTLVVPFCSLQSFYDEYKIHSVNNQTPVDNFAGQTVFTEAYDHLHKTQGIRKLKARGTFNTCEICNNADSLLKNKHKKLTTSQRHIIQKFRQLHIIQQSNERRFLDVKKLKAAHMDGNRPRAALVFPDFMTEYTCQTPTWEASSSSDMKIDSRLLGIEVYCGPIKTVFIYRIDALVVGGADIMVECVRQAIIDLLKLLRGKGLLSPKALWLQFDNCGENKNKLMFAYASVLVEDLHFDEVEICFLIVGHTHASIDQYFSLISHKIHSKQTVFIGSPLALLELVRQVHYHKYTQDPIVREITVYYDVSNAFKPYINRNIKFYQIPHYFIIQRIFGRISAMQSKMLSTNRYLLPLRPDKALIDKDSMLALLLNEVPLPTSFAMMDGVDAVKFHLLGSEKFSTAPGNNGPNHSSNQYTLKTTLTSDGEAEMRAIDITTDEAFGNVEKSKLLLTVSKLLPDLEKLCGEDSIYQQECRMQDEEEGTIPKRSYKLREDLVKKIRKVSKPDKGYICWLNINSKRNELTPWKDVINPIPFNPQSILDKFLDIKEVVETEEKEQRDELEDEDNENDEIYSSILPSFRSESKLSHRSAKSVSRNQMEASSNNKNKIPLEKREKRIYIAASNISKTVRWVLQQIKTSKIFVSGSTVFDENTFKAPVINQLEYKWYLARNSAEKVLSLAVEEFQNAEPWEPFPSAQLSYEDSEALKLEQLRQDELEAEAVKLGENLVQRFTDKAKETDQIISYGINDKEGFIPQISEHFKNRRNSGGASKNNEVKYYRCDIRNCLTITHNESRCSVCTTKLRFCDSHIEHSVHNGVGKKSNREQVSKEDYITQIKERSKGNANDKNSNSTNVDDNNSKDDENCNDSTTNNSTSNSKDVNEKNTNNLNSKRKNNNKFNEGSEVRINEKMDSNSTNTNDINSKYGESSSEKRANNIISKESNENIRDILNNKSKRINDNKCNSKLSNKQNNNENSNNNKNKNNNNNITKKHESSNKNSSGKKRNLDELSTDNNINDKSTESSGVNLAKDYSGIITKNRKIKDNKKLTSYNNNDINDKFSFIFNIINTDDEKVDENLLQGVREKLFKNAVLFKDEQDSRYKIFLKIRRAVINGKMSEVSIRLENLFMEWPQATNDLKYLISNIFDLELALPFDWKSTDVLKKSSQRKEFVREFVKVFVEKYCSHSC